MDCRDFKKKLSLFLDGKLPAAEQKTVKKHLKDCRECEKYLESITKMVGAMNKKEGMAGEINPEEGTGPGKHKPENILKILLPVIFIALALVLVSIEHISDETYSHKDTDNSIPPKTTLSRTPADKQAVKEAVLPAAQAEEKLKKEPAPEKIEKVVVEDLKFGNFIARNREQKWIMHAEDKKALKTEIAEILKQFDAADIVTEDAKTGADGFLCKFVVRFGELNPLMERLGKLCSLERQTPAPVIRSEAYVSSRGGVNPLVLEEKIPVQLEVKD